MRTSGKRALARLSALPLALAALAPLSGAATEKLVVEAGRIVTQDGPDVEDGVIVIEGGRITALGPASEVQKPWDAPVVGGPEFVAFPGFVEAHTSNGMDRANEAVDVAPFLNIRDSVDPVSFFFEDCLRSGITTINVQQGEDCVIAGQGMIVKPVGMTVEEMLVRPSFGLKLSAAPKRGKSRGTQSQALREAFAELRRYLEELVQEKRDGLDYARREALYQGRDLEGENAEGRAMEGAGWTVEGLELVPRGEIEEKQEPLLELVEGRWDVFFYCGAPMDVHLALEVARDNGFLEHTTLVLDDSCWKAADVIAEAGVPVVLDSSLVHVERDPVTGDEIETFVPGVFAEKGVEFALSSRNASDRSLWYQAAFATGRGLDRQAALDAVTTVPAKILGLEGEVGSLKPGAAANVLLLTGDPLSVTTWVEHVIVDGRHAYDRSEDVRYLHLYEGQAPPLGAAAGVEEEGEHDHGHGDGEDHDDEEEADDDEEGEE